MLSVFRADRMRRRACGRARCFACFGCADDGCAERLLQSLFWSCTLGETHVLKWLFAHVLELFLDLVRIRVHSDLFPTPKLVP
mmetsp:Transcript_48358/g.155877  ORF Transcript_48358/g.155877 Transcript_48358/m.155877 type:complete len:83 (+) Transcript_48358:634-882(+)